VPTGGVLVDRARVEASVEAGIRSWPGIVLLAAMVLGGSLNSGCATPPPCQCACEACYSDGAPKTTTEASLAGDPNTSQSSEASPDRGTGRSRRGASRAGETLAEAQLLERYEGKRAARVFTGKATYYANSLAGNKTASGEVYDPKVFSAAHRTLPFGTVVRVVRTDTNKYVYVRITDRGPFAGGGRIIDLSYVAAERLGMIRTGVVPVRLEVLQ
jgi:rare lipoprotein A